MADDVHTVCIGTVPPVLCTGVVYGQIVWPKQCNKLVVASYISGDLSQQQDCLQI